MALLAGTGCVEITPPVGTPLAGFAARDHGAEGIHDPLYAKALVLDDEEKRICLITNDLIGLPGSLVARIRAHIEEETGLPGSHVMLNCSHTHSGPQIKPEEDYAAVLVRQIAGAAAMAVRNLRPAKLGFGRGPVQLGINRREWRNGEIVLGRNPEGPVAPYVDVVRIDETEGRPLAILFAHACHPVTRAADSYLISADYPGQAQAIVELVYPGAQAMFAQGCSGNVNSEPVGGSWEDVRRLGTMLAGEVLKVREEIVTTADVRLAAGEEIALLPIAKLPEKDEIDRELAAAEENLAAAQASGVQTRINVQKAFRDTWAKIKEMKEKGEEFPPYEFPLQGLAIGDLAILGLPGEIFVEYQLFVDEISPFRQTLTLGCTNGSGAYIPTAAALPEGGYEVRFTPLWWGRLPFAPELEANLQDGLRKLLENLQAQLASRTEE